MTEAKPAPAPAPEEKPKPAGRRLEWPTLWHGDQIPFPWGSAKRLRKQRTPEEKTAALLAKVKPP